MTYKKKSVHLEESIHRRIKLKAIDSTIEKVVNDILKKELDKEEIGNEKTEKNM